MTSSQKLSVKWNTMHNFEIKSKNYEILSHNYEIKSPNYEIKQ